MLSPVERRFLKLSGRQESYPSEKIPTLEVVNIYELGKIVALRFLEWCHENPKGVVALPTGRTPEFFIKTLEAYKTGWDTPEVRMEVTGFGFTRSEWPDTTGLTFVMLDEFFPMLPTHRNSFCLYIRTFYATLLDIPEERILTFDLVKSGILTDTEITELSAFDIDVSLLERQAVNEQEDKIKSVLTRVDAYCQSYEEKIQSLGGIGFFLGGIGPDGHVAFNQEGCDHECRTRLVNFNYPSAAAAAGDLGGIEIARGMAAMTIGLQTIRNNPDATIIVMAAGEGKASVVRDAIEEGVDRKRPASAFQGHSGARFYITHGAAKKLPARQAEDIQKVPLSCIEWALNHLSGLITDRPHLVEPTMEYLQMENLLYETSFETKVPVHELNVEHLDQTPQGRASPAWLHSELNFKLLRSCASRRLREKVEGGLRSVSMKHQSILHTAPHHDDIMLSYHAAMHEMMGRRCVDEDGHPVQPKHRPRWGRGDMSDMDLGEATNDNVNHFAYLTSGFHSVNDSFWQKQEDAVRGPDGLYKFLSDAVLAGEITRDYDDLMGEFRSAFFAQNFKAQDRVEHIIFLRKMAEVFNVRVTLAYQSLIRELGKAVENLRVEYLDKHSPGDGIPKDIQLLKGCMRESEVDRVWALSNMPMNRVHHMRSKFYTDDFFTPMPSLVPFRSHAPIQSHPKHANIQFSMIFCPPLATLVTPGPLHH